MDITRAAIEKNRFTLVILLVILALGIASYLRMPRSEDPGFIVRAALVTTYFPGASPERVEQLVTDKLESTIQEIPELDYVKSQSKTGISVIVVNIREEFTDMRPIWDKLRRKVERAAADLPDGVTGPTVNDEFGEVFGVIVTIAGDGFSYASVKDYADQSRDLLLRIDDVAKVDIYGAQEERVFVEYNNARLAEVGLSPVQLRNILANRNIIIPGGTINAGVERIALEPSGNFESLDDLRRTIITVPGSSELLYLEDLADVYRDYIDPPRAKVTTSGVPGLALAISMREGGNILTLGEQVKAALADVQNRFPLGIEFDVVSFQPDVVDVKVKSFIGNIYQAVAIVLGIMLIMLGLRTGLVVASLIPSAMIMSLLVMSFFDIGLDQMSLAALIIALGMLVDNAIVMSESIVMQMAEGINQADAAIGSAKELSIPLLTSSLTTAAAFLPIFLAKSTTGEYTAPLFKVVTITLLCSWILSLTVIPLLCAKFLKVKKNQDTGPSFQSPFYKVYRGLLLKAVRFAWVSLLLVVGLFGLSLYGLRYVPTVFFPPSDTAMFTVDLELPVGTAIEYTEQVVQRIDQYVKDELQVNDTRTVGVSNWSSYIGRGGPRFVLSYNPTQPSPEVAFMLINATSRDLIPDLASQLESHTAENFPDLTVSVRPLQLGPSIAHPVEIRLSGSDTRELFTIANQVKSELAATGGVSNIGDDWGQRSKKIVVSINEARARRAGISNQDIAVSLQTILSGIDTTDYREEDEVIPVSLRSVAADRQDMGRLESLNVYSQLTGRSVPLKQVADLGLVWEPARIFRRDRLRTVTVYADVQPGTTAQDIAHQMIPVLGESEAGWPLGFSYEMGGEFETSGKANASISEQLPVAGLLILILLVGQFNSIRCTAVILFTIPLSLIGVVVGLLIAKSYFGFMTLLGVVSLAGIVINNAIVLIDRIRIEIERGMTPARAVIDAAQRRLRPILLTTMTTVGGLIPLWLGGGPMWEPMAIAIMFGLVVATALTLGVVPVLYTILFRVNYKGFRYDAA